MQELPQLLTKGNAHMQIPAPLAWRRQNLRKLRASGTQRIAELNLPHRYDVSDLVHRLCELRNRQITIIQMNMKPSHPCGMWVVARNEDVICYDGNTTKAHQEHIILHELGHIICCHRGTGILDNTSARLLFPDLNPDIVREMLMRATYNDVQEQEAEILAYLLSERIGSQPATVQDPLAGATLARIQRTLA